VQPQFFAISSHSISIKMKKQPLNPLPLTGVCAEVMQRAHQVDSERIHLFLTPASIERLILYITQPHAWNIEGIAYHLQMSPPKESVLAVTPYQRALTSRKVIGHIIVNPLETTTLAPVTAEVRYMSTDALLDWLTDLEHPEAPEIRAAFVWLVSAAARRAARNRIAERDARIKDLEKLEDRVFERDSVISQLQSDLGNVLFDLNRAKRRVDTLERSIADTSAADTTDTATKCHVNTREVDLVNNDCGFIDVRVTKRPRRY
jgi:hypothetical protein